MQRGDAEDVLAELRGRRTGTRGGTGSVPRSQALRLSSAWACLRLRADIVSTMPIDVFRRVQGVQVEQTKPPIMLNPDGGEYGWEDWLYRSQFDLDSVGNTMGKIVETDATRPAVIELWNACDVAVGKRDGQRYYRHGGQVVDARFVWHERQYPLAGAPLGLSPIAHAALAMQPALSAAQFAAMWFSGAATPAQHLKNVAKKLNKREARAVKANFENQVEDGGLFVSGQDWELKVLGAKAAESMFLEQQKFTPNDVCRFLGVPADMIDAETSTGSITYANVTQRNLQFLILNLNPALIRREKRFSRDLLPAPRYAQFNRNALLQMDALTRFQVYAAGITNRIYTPDEVRDLENMPPLSPEDKALFKEFWPPKAGGPSPAPDPAPAPAPAPGGPTS
jgi:HK97 family phage portal protein